MNSRRSFLLTTTTALTAARALYSQDDPFAAISPGLWKNARQNGLIMIHRDIPRHIESSAQIATSAEPGDRLTVSGQVFAPDGSTPAAGVTVYAYNTDAQGYYGVKRSEYPPRIYGWMKTDAAGRFELHTIFPGRYPGMRVPAHIHFELWAGGYPLQAGESAQFAGDSYLTAQMIADDAKLGAFHTVQEVRNGRCDHRIRLGSVTTFR